MRLTRLCLALTAILILGLSIWLWSLPRAPEIMHPKAGQTAYKKAAQPTSAAITGNNPPQTRVMLGDWPENGDEKSRRSPQSPAPTPVPDLLPIPAFTPESSAPYDPAPTPDLAPPGPAPSPVMEND